MMLKKTALTVFKFLPFVIKRRISYFLGDKFTVGVLGIIEKNNKILLVKHSYHHYKWGLPGGLIKNGEEPKAALARELKEELGINIKVGKIIQVKNIKEMHQVVIVFLCTDLNGDIKIDHEEIEKAEFFSKKDLPPIVNTYQPFIDSYYNSGKI